MSVSWNAINRWDKQTRVDLRSSMWTCENCKIVTDFPQTVVNTPTLGKPSFMYAALKLTPALYDFNICMQKGAPCSCTAEIIEVMAGGERKSRNRCAAESDVQQTLRWMVTADSNVELRLRFNDREAMRVVSFDRMVVRSRRKLAMPFKTHVLSGVQTMVRLTYRLNDLHRVLKMAHYAINWLRTVDSLVTDLLNTISSPLWDPTENTHEFAHMAQTLHDTLVGQAPRNFFATNSYYRIQLDTQLRLPLISRTLLARLSDCIMADNLEERKQDVLASMHHSLHYINFMIVEYVEFKQKLQDKISKNGGRDEVGAIDTIELPLGALPALAPTRV